LRKRRDEKMKGEHGGNKGREGRNTRSGGGNAL
jgi:hypothetical protein